MIPRIVSWLYRSFRPEEDIIMLFCRYSFSRSSIDKKKLIQSLRSEPLTVATSRFQQLVAGNQLFPLIFEITQENDIRRNIPLSVVEFIQKGAAERFFTQAILEKEYRHILQQLVRENVHFIILKNLYYKQYILASDSQKVERDLDVLLAPRLLNNEFETPKNILKRNKYIRKSMTQGQSLVPNDQDVFYKKIRVKKNVVIRSIVELHHRIVFAITWKRDFFNSEDDLLLTQELFRNTRKIRLFNLDLFVLNYTYQLFTLCLHFGIHHNYESLFSAYEIACFLRKYDKKIDWPQFVQIAYRLRMYDHVMWVLCLIADIFRPSLVISIDAELSFYRKNVSFFRRLILSVWFYKSICPTNFEIENNQYEKLILWTIITKIRKRNKILYVIVLSYHYLIHLCFGNHVLALRD